MQWIPLKCLTHTRGRLAGVWEPEQAQAMAMFQAPALAPVLEQAQLRVRCWAQSAPAKGRLWGRLPVLAKALVGWILEAELRAPAQACCSERALETQPWVRPRVPACRRINEGSSQVSTGHSHACSALLARTKEASLNKQLLKGHASVNSALLTHPGLPG